MNMDYNIHFLNRDYVFVNTTQLKMISYDVQDVIGQHIQKLITPAEFSTIASKIDRVFFTGEPLYHIYNVKGWSFLVLLNKIDNDTIAAHEVIDDPYQRPRLKRFLWAASGNFYKRYYKENVG